MTLKEFRKNNPEYNDIPDLELADKFYKKFYSDQDETEYYKRLFPEIAAERAEDVYTDFIFPDDEFGGFFEYESAFKPITSDIAKKAGVSVNNPATSKARFGASLGYNQEQKALAIKNSLSKLYKQDIDVRIGPNTGELEYYNPKTQEYALVDKPGLDMGDFADLGGDAMVILPDIAATIVGTVYSGGNIPAGITAGGLAAGVGEFARLKLGQKLYNINMDLTDEELFYEGFKAAGISITAGTLGVGAAKLIKSTVNFLKGRHFASVSEGVAASKSTQALEASKIANSVNKKLADANVKSKLQYTLAEAANDKDLLAIQRSFETSKRLGKTGEFREFAETQAGSLNKYFEILKKEFGSPTGSTFDTGVDIKKVLDKRNKDSIKKIIKKQEVSEDLLTKSLFRLPDGSEKITGIQFRSIINDLSQSYKSKANLAAKELDNVVGLKVINTDEIAKAMAKLSKKETENLINIAKVEGIFKKDVFNNLVDPLGKISLSSARETISTLGKLIREKEIGLAAGESVDVGRLKFLKKTFTEQVKKDAGSDYLNELQRFNDLVIKNKELLNNDIISKLTKIEIGNILKVGDEAIFETTFKKGAGNGKVAKEVYDVISNSPEALNAYKNSIFNKYKADVLDVITKKPNLSRHNAFIKTYEKPLRIFFNEAEYSKISRIGGLQKNIEKTNKLVTKITNELNKSFEGKLLNASPSEIFNKIYRPGAIGEIKTLKNILQKNSEIYKKFQRDVLSDLNEKVLGPPSKNISLDKVLDAKAFDKYLNGGGGERGYKAALRVLFGDEYVKNLDILNNALKIASRSAPAAEQGFFANAFSDIIRARLGQFTFAGRMFTAGRRIFTGAANRIIAKALLNPNSLRDLIALKTLSRKSKQAAVILAKLGGSIFLTLPDDGVSVPPKEAVIEDVKTPNLFREREKSFQFFPNKSTTGGGGGGEMGGNTVQIQTPQINTPGISEALLATASARPTGITASGLTPTELGLLSPEEQAIRLRQRGMA